jgi:RNA 2',3'-cyclic 3'-phosphodiesterase
VRLFVAVRPPPPAVDHAAAAVNAVRPLASGLRWVPAERWHLTLAFYGEVPDDEVDRVVARTGRRLEDAVEMGLALTGAGRFGSRAVWLGVTGDVAALRLLAGALDPGGRRYRPHLTVARVRDGTGTSAVVAALSGYAGPTWTAGAVHLVRSRLGPAPAYDDVATWPLLPLPPRP